VAIIFLVFELLHHSYSDSDGADASVNSPADESCQRRTE